MVSKKLTIPLALALSLSFNHHVVGEGYKETSIESTINNSAVQMNYQDDLEFIQLYKKYVIEQELEETKLEIKRKEEMRKKQLEAQRYRTLTVNASAYVAFCDTGCTGETAIGHDVSSTIYYKGYRIIAVDPNIIPLYSIVEIEGNDERFIAIDTGGAIDGNRIDILVANESIAWNFGRKDLKVKVIREGKGK